MSRLTDHYVGGEFLERIAAAYDAPNLTDRDWQFLSDIEAKHHRWGGAMYFSDRQAEYLESLAERGENYSEADDADEIEIIHVARPRKSHRAKERSP
jgi:hypothetical protein